MKVGIDLIEIERVKKLLQRHPAAKQRLFTEEEISYCERQVDPYPSYAARFAAKEAVFKALGEFIGWRNVSVRRDSGKPILFVKGKKARAELSLSHTKGLAVAIVVFLE